LLLEREKPARRHMIAAPGINHPVESLEVQFASGSSGHSAGGRRPSTRAKAVVRTFRGGEATVHESEGGGEQEGEAEA